MNTITTEGIYKKGIIVPKIKPTGQRAAIITFLPPSKRKLLMSDEEIWRDVEPYARKIRQKILRDTYPDLHGKFKKKVA